MLREVHYQMWNLPNLVIPGWVHELGGGGPSRSSTGLLSRAFLASEARGRAEGPAFVPSRLTSSDRPLPPLQKHTEEITKIRKDFERQVRGQRLPRSV